MSSLLNILSVGVVFLLMVVVLVAVHELGHFLLARLFGAGVEEFAIGVGRPKLFTWLRRKSVLPDGSAQETEFTVRAWPVGGFVRIRGMEIQDDGSEVSVPGGFYALAPWRRFVILLAGPVFSVVFGIVVLTALYSMRGVYRQTTVVSDVIVGSAADKAGMRPGDKIVAIGGRSTPAGYDAEQIVWASGGKPLKVEILHRGERKTLDITPRLDPEPTPVIDERGGPTGDFRRQGKLGIGFTVESVPTTGTEALGESWAMTESAAANVLRTFARPSHARENVGGVISMVAATNEVVSDSLASTVHLAAVLSISIGLFNLLPIPPLDGGQMLVSVVEMLRRGRRLSIRAQLAFLNVGALLLVVMIVGVLALDVSKLVVPPKVPVVKTLTAEPSTAPARRP